MGIVLDTPNQERIKTQKHIYCRELIVVDHHPKIDSFAHLEFINHTYSSTSEILSEIYLYLERSQGFHFEAPLCKYLYSGIITDSNHLKDHVTPSTYYVLWRLLDKGINRKEITDYIVENTLNKKLFDQTVVRNIRVTKNGLAFSIISSRVLKKYLIEDYLSAITNLESIAGIEVWVILIQDKSLRKWKCSIRSKELPIDNVAYQFKGGGHKRVASVLFKYKWEFWSLIHFLDDYLVKFGYSNSSNYGKFGRSWIFTLYDWYVKLSEKGILAKIK
ncbi:tRNA-nucleotidyltransferase/poly(A) polymerase family protein [Candidatus Mycoplasma haematolamae str. Purdue]|uniref:tRNA-nucleotidyltransferase/poly(A) polymerase family protein n=1 Tax=Mycoplasma haematolamae (strain Purdue) TaxID=1212765 RepID=I7BIP9_MYCHA|nr:tRNA-nucleotidyltransferase/poly(A) polymerase family protein [Candidatus Mycoplasma haematolamae str. Purdue]